MLTPLVMIKIVIPGTTNLLAYIVQRDIPDDDLVFHSSYPRCQASAQSVYFIEIKKLH